MVLDDAALDLDPVKFGLGGPEPLAEARLRSLTEIRSNDTGGTNPLPA